MQNTQLNKITSIFLQNTEVLQIYGLCKVFMAEDIPLMFSYLNGNISRSL